ncbi:MAG: peptidase S9, partial [Gemmatimonadota bacterium]|nr:peptidase S9 [Gemmatimonadota bacterium]
MLRRTAPALLCLLLGLPGLLPAQYFGRNKVQYTNFDFKVIQTEHFDVYFYERERTAAMDAARMAERSYARLSKVLNHEFRERKPIILYASHSDFQQTNATDAGGEGTQGVTDFARNRAVLPFTGSYAEFEHVLMHEMVHQFQYDVWSRGRAGAGIQTLIAIAPPLWFVEGMAEYLSVGPINAETAMWIRDASLEGKLPTIEQLTGDPYEFFPYRFGHALWSYIGERWGDEAVGAILKGTLSGGIEPAFRRTIGMTLEQLSDQWRDAVQKRYLPEIGARARARAVAEALLTEKRSDGTLHLAPALSPDGSQVVYFSEKDFYYVDLYLADGMTGKVKRRILKSGISSNYETYRFLNSQANWSPDGKYLALAAKQGPRDDIVIVDVARNKQVKQIKLKLSGVTTPAWSPDGEHLVFTGYDGGLSDLFIVKRDGSGLRRLTADKYADLHPVWSPDGKSIAFATDRGPATDFRSLATGSLRIAIYDLASGTVRALDGMDHGKNVSPQWAPDGRSIAFVSDRSGVSNIFLYDLDDRGIYQLTDFYTGAQGITPLSPVLSWARQADRLAFVYYEDKKFDVYTIANPRSLKRGRYRPQ